jgi:hypothetical protein
MIPNTVAQNTWKFLLSRNDGNPTPNF